MFQIWNQEKWDGGGIYDLSCSRPPGGDFMFTIRGPRGEPVSTSTSLNESCHCPVPPSPPTIPPFLQYPQVVFPTICSLRSPGFVPDSPADFFLRVFNTCCPSLMYSSWSPVISLFCCSGAQIALPCQNKSPCDGAHIRQCLEIGMEADSLVPWLGSEMSNTCTENLLSVTTSIVVMGLAHRCWNSSVLSWPTYLWMVEISLCCLSRCPLCAHT